MSCRLSLLFGVLCAWAVRDEKTRRKLETRRAWLYVVFGVLIFGIGCLTVFAHGQSYYKLFTSFEMISFGYSLLAMFYACLLLVVVTQKTGVVNDVMRWAWLRHFGFIAYGVFIMHMAVNSGKRHAGDLLDRAIMGGL